MAARSRSHIPPDIIYGTAWKMEKSATLVEAALNAGFRALDTAGSRSAYRESLVGEGIAAALASGDIKRSELYIQTKFSPFKAGKDPALYPYDTEKSIPEQVTESLKSSFANLGVTYLDSLILHSLYPTMEDTITAWKAMESLVPSQVTSIGVSDVSLEVLRQLYEIATVKPSVVQNRFTQDTIHHPNPELPSNLPLPLVPFDRDVREFCSQYEINYAPWGMLWGSLDFLDGPEKNLLKAGNELGISREIACYACLQSLGGCKISLLCGTTHEGRMRDTLAGLVRVKEYESESEENKKTWHRYVQSFKDIVDGDRSLRPAV